ncbi:MAG: hypothetical protein U1F43_32795 [Myxococcota bacterium]
MKRHAIVTLLCGLTLAACADDTALPPGLQCEGSRECEHGLACSFNYCIDPTPNALTMMARIIPPPSTGLLPQQVPSFSVADGPNLLVRLLGSAHVRGVVTQKGAPSVTNVPGEIEIHASDVIAGFEHRFSTTSLEGINDGYGYDLLVLPGRDYAGTFRPSDPDLPRSWFVLPREAVDAGRFDLELPAKSEYVTVRGRVRREEPETPVLGARVVVLVNKTEVAAVTQTDDIRGMFEVLVAPGIEKVRLEIEAPDAGAIFPDFVTDEFVLGSDELTVVVPNPPLDVAPYDAAIHVEAPDGSPAVGLSVTIQGVLEGGTIRRNAITDKDGVAHVNVLSGPYECLVIVPPELAMASWHGFVDLGLAGLATGAAVGTTIQLAPRPTLSGHITDAFGMPVSPGTLTLARDIEKKEGEQLVIAPPDLTLDLDEDGGFTAQVDPGSWDLVIAPDPVTGAPNAHESDIEVGPDGLSLDVALPPPGLLHLTVGGPDGPFMPDVTVELWLPPVGSDVHPRLLARGTTTAQGFVDLLVPHLTTGPGSR